MKEWMDLDIPRLPDGPVHKGNLGILAQPHGG